MRIGIFDPYLDDMGGGEKYMLTIASCLSEEHDVTIFWNKRDDLDLTVQRFSIDLTKVKVGANIFSHDVSLPKRLLESRKFDVIFFLSDGSLPLVLSKKLILHAQQPINNIKNSFKTSIKMNRVSKVFCNSYFTKDFIDKSLGIESEVIYPPITLKPKKLKKENIILTVGRFRVKNVGVSDYKKLGVLVDAFKKISKKLDDWKFFVASGVKEDDENEFNKLKESAKNYPIEFHVNKTNDELWDLYSKAKIYWHAAGFGEDLVAHPDYAEHFGISTVEAMGAGAVPVVINAGGQKEIVEDNVSGFLWNKLSDLEEKTLLLSKEEKIMESVSIEAIKRAKDFAGDRFCEEIKKLIK